MASSLFANRSTEKKQGRILPWLKTDKLAKENVIVFPLHPI